MMTRVTIYFEDEKLRKDLEVYSRKHGKSFSETVLEFAGAGFSLFQKTGSLNIDLLMEKLNRVEEVKREIEFLRGIIASNTDQVNKLLGVGNAPTDKPNLPTKSNVEIPEATEPEKPWRNIELPSIDEQEE